VPIALSIGKQAATAILYGVGVFGLIWLLKLPSRRDWRDRPYAVRVATRLVTGMLFWTLVWLAGQAFF
jgi:hypothetical protein